jgi:hypothetical protein
MRKERGIGEGEGEERERGKGEIGPYYFVQISLSRYKRPRAKIKQIKNTHFLFLFFRTENSTDEYKWVYL